MFSVFVIKICFSFKIFFYILEVTRIKNWVYADVSCAAYPLDQLDTITESGTVNTKSCLYIILKKVNLYFLKTFYF